MRTRSVVAVLGVGLLSSVVSGEPVCSGPQDALQWFNYGVPVPAQCVEQMTEQAIAFCNDYLQAEAVTTYLSTVTSDVTPVTVSETSTTLTTTTELVTTTEPTTLTEIATESATTTTTATFEPLQKRRGDAVPVCPGNCINLATDCLQLTTPNLIRRPAQDLDLYCRCLGVAVTTVTVEASTATAPTSTTTETAVETDVVSETSLTTETELTIITQTTTQIETSTTTSTVNPT